MVCGNLDTHDPGFGPHGVRAGTMSLDAILALLQVSTALGILYLAPVRLEATVRSRHGHCLMSAGCVGRYVKRGRLSESSSAW